MINTLKTWIEKIKLSAIAKPFITTKRWFQDNVIKRKLVIFSMLFTAWVSLLLGAIYSPQRQTYTDEQLKTKRTFENGTGEIRLSSQTYSPKTGVIVLQFETKDSTSPVDRGIDAKRLKWDLYAQKKSVDTTMEIVPIIDNKISVIIRNVPEDFGAFAIDITNKTVSTSDIDIDVSSPSDGQEQPSKAKEHDDGNVVQFYVTTQNSKLKKEKIKSVSREEFALSEIIEEKVFQEGQIKKLNNSIEQLKASIEDDEARKNGLLKEAEYLSGDDLESNQKDVATIESNIETKNRSIETATQNIEKVQAKIVSLEKKETAVKDGTFEFSNPIETVEMK
ncbi:TPA: coiled-coil domain-containing protein [Streptococcus agalactiae]